MDVLRTPDERFRDLPDFGLPPSYAEVADPDDGVAGFMASDVSGA